MHLITLYRRLNMYIPPLRKKEKIIEEIKKRDKDSVLTYYIIDNLIKKGYIKEIKYGNACLVNIDELAIFFNSIGEKR